MRKKEEKNEMKKKGEYMKRNNVGMNRGGFVKAVGAGAAAIAGAAMFGSGVAHAVGPQNPTTIYTTLGAINDVTREEVFENFMSEVLNNASIDLEFGGRLPGMTINDVVSGNVTWGSGLSMQAGTGMWTHLYWHQPFMDISLTEFVDWLFNGGGLALRQQILNTQYGEKVKVLPYVIGSGEGGGWSKGPIEYLIADPSNWSMRVSGPLMSGILGQAFPEMNLPPSDVGFSDTSRLLLTPSNPLYINSLEFHIPTADEQILNTAYPQISTIEDMHYYIDCWWSKASIWELWINWDYWMYSLTPQQRKAIEEASMESVYYNMEQTLIKQDLAIQLWKEAGVTIHQQWPTYALDLLEYAKEVKFAEWSADNNFSKVLKSMEQFLGRKL